MFDLQQFAFVGLGSNLGDSAANVRRAMGLLQDLSSVPLLRSSLWKSEPVECPPDSPPFINAVAGLLPLPSETALSLLRALVSIERQLGRKPKTMLNEPRPLDLDLLLFGKYTLQSPELTLPHPRAYQRRFVLAPLEEVAPTLVPPGTSYTVRALLAALPAGQAVQRLP